ncbi:MAG: ATPase, T2SS/T4P/T4SS family [Nitrospiraceae bacterium]|nr:ATPase, T2SS/T4P/T4SS family [Nitrospiraceae bacterium]
MQKELSIEDMAGLREVFSQAKSFDATDIYILQDRVPRLGRLKDYYPMTESSEITQADIEQFTLTTMADRKNGAAKEHYSHSEYAFSIKEHGRYRVSSTRSEEGIGLSIRKLPYFIPALTDIDKRNFLKGLKSVFEGKETTGLILHTGITGSGKSTSIASEVDTIARNISGNIFTFEDPIEYRYTRTKAMIRQYEVGRDVPSYIEGMKFALRNNVSVIVIGEVRLHEEIRAMVDIAMRGHLVFATLHTSNALNTIRFLDSVSEDKDSWRQLIAYSLRAVISQKLLWLKDRGFVFIPEVFIPNSMVRNKISRGEFKEVKEAFYSNNLRENGSFTFDDSLNILCKQGILSDNDKRSINEDLCVLG